MKVTAWRIVKVKYAGTAFDGEGARLFGGRWSSKGTRAVYAAGSQALAVLEMLVHLDASDLLRQYRLLSVTFSQQMVSGLDLRTLPGNWRRRATPSSVRAIGDDWIASGRSAVLRVPSVIVPGEHNYVINVMHPDFAKMEIGKPRPYQFDPRLM